MGRLSPTSQVRKEGGEMNVLRVAMLPVLLLATLIGGCAGTHPGTGRPCDPCCRLRRDFRVIGQALTDTGGLADDCSAIGEALTDTSGLRRIGACCAATDLSLEPLRDDCRAIGAALCDTSGLRRTLAIIHEQVCCPDCPGDY